MKNRFSFIALFLAVLFIAIPFRGFSQESQQKCKLEANTESHSQCENKECTCDSILKSINSYVEQVREDWRIPGLSLSVVKDGEIILSKGYGVKLMGTDDPVDENTIYQIGSVSKSFTGAVMASLVDEGLEIGRARYSIFRISTRCCIPTEISSIKASGSTLRP